MYIYLNANYALNIVSCTLYITEYICSTHTSVYTAINKFEMKLDNLRVKYLNT